MFYSVQAPPLLPCSPLQAEVSFAGVKPTRMLTVSSSDHGAELAHFLSRSLNISVRKAKSALDRRDIFVNRRRTWMARHVLKKGDLVEVVSTEGRLHARPAAPAAEPVQILYRDSNLIVAAKPPGICSCGTDSFESILSSQLGLTGLNAAHRLDKDTTGCLICTLDQSTFRAVVELFRNREVIKRYRAVVEGRIGRKSMTISVPVGGRRSLSRVEMLDRNARASHVLVEIETGRTHQIRKHLASVGHPVVGDRTYGDPRSPQSRAAPRQMLHADTIAFEHPIHGGQLSVCAPIPDDFLSCLKEFGLK